MRKKQLFALILTGALAVGMAPSAAFAAEEGSALSIEGETEVGAGEDGEATPTDPAENPDVGDGGGETGDGGQGGEATPTPEQPPVEVPPTEVPPTETPTQTPEEEEGNLPQNKETPDATATPTPELKAGAGAIVMDGTSYNTLAEAVAAATATLESEKPSAIIITGDLEIEETVAVPAGKNIVITAGAENTTISRKEGFKGDLFKVDGATLQFSAGLVDDQGQTQAGSLTVDGSQEDPAAVEGSLVAVANGGTFGLLDGVTLTGNKSSANGGAIRNEGGNIALFGGTITGNSAAAGGAVYSTSPIAVKGTVKVMENKGSDGLTENNIALSGETAVINIGGAMTDSQIGVLVVDGAAGAQVLAVAPGVEGVSLADVLPQFTYNAEGFAIDEEGKLKTAEVTPSPTPTEALKLKGIDMKWTGLTSARITCNSNKDGWYYAAWVTRGSKAPEFDLEKEGVAVKADRNFTIDFTDLDPDKPIDVYVRVKDKEDNLSKKMLFQLDEDTRPRPTPTPTGRAPIIPKVTESVVQGLDKPLEFYPGVYHKFTVIGAGTQNMDPVQGDVKWVPKYWAMSTNPTDAKKNRSWEIGARDGLLKADTYNMYVFFQKNEYDGEQWQELDTIEYAGYQFRSAAISITPTPSVQGQQGNGNNNGSGDDPESRTADGDVTGATSNTGAVATADESPIGSMMTLAMASLLAGGYVLVRRRKKINE